MPHTTPRRTPFRHAAPRGGFTLIEVLISMAILVIALTVLATLIPAAAITQRHTTRDIEALITANNAVAIYNGKRLPGYLMTFLSSRHPVNGGPYPRGASGINAGQLDLWLDAGDYQFENSGGNYYFKEYLDAEYICGNYFPTDNKVENMPSWFSTALDTNASGGIGTGSKIESGDLTLDMDSGGSLHGSANYDAGRIGANHRRSYNVIKGYQTLDLSYPTSLNSPGDRRFFCTSMSYDQNQNVQAPDYWLALFLMSRGDPSGNWPEKALYIQGNTEVGFWAGGDDPYQLLTDKDGVAYNPADDYNVYNCWRTSSASTDGIDTPTLVRIPAFVYDYDKNVIRVLYPPCYWDKTATGNPDGVDRRLRSGDKFMPFEGGATVFTVVSAANVPGSVAGCRSNAASGTTNMQDLTVYPPLNATMLGRNTDPPGQTNWKLSRIYYAPPSTAGGPSPCVMIRKVHCDRAFSFSPND